MLHQVGDLFELNVKLRCQKVKSILVKKLWRINLAGRVGRCWVEKDYKIRSRKVTSVQTGGYIWDSIHLTPTTTANCYKVKSGLRMGQETASCRQTAAEIEGQLEELRIFVKLIFITPFLLLRHIQF